MGYIAHYPPALTGTMRIVIAALCGSGSNHFATRFSFLNFARIIDDFTEGLDRYVAPGMTTKQLDEYGAQIFKYPCFLIILL